MKTLITTEEKNVLIKHGLYDESIFKVNEENDGKIIELSKFEFDLFMEAICTKNNKIKKLD